MKKTRDIKLYGEALPTWDSSDADLVIYADTQPTAVVLGFERYKKLVRLESIAEKRLMDDTEKTADISELDETTKECRHVYTDEQLKAENERLRDDYSKLYYQFDLLKEACGALREDNRELDWCLARADSEIVKLSEKDGERLLEILDNPEEPNEALKGIMREHAGVVEKKESTVTLQDAVDGAEKASKRIDGWPEWKELMAYRYHDDTEEGE